MIHDSHFQELVLTATAVVATYALFMLQVKHAVLATKSVVGLFLKKA
jgi:hypothetical protein